MNKEMYSELATDADDISFLQLVSEHNVKYLNKLILGEYAEALLEINDQFLKYSNDIVNNAKKFKENADDIQYEYFVENNSESLKKYKEMINDIDDGWVFITDPNKKD